MLSYCLPVKLKVKAVHHLKYEASAFCWEIRERHDNKMDSEYKFRVRMHDNSY